MTPVLLAWQQPGRTLTRHVIAIGQMLMSALLIAAVGAFVAYRNERVFATVHDITRELEKVSWPTRKETSAATVVVLVMVAISAIILSGFDAIWAFFTNWFLR